MMESRCEHDMVFSHSFHSSYQLISRGGSCCCCCSTSSSSGGGGYSCSGGVLLRNKSPIILTPATAWRGQPQLSFSASSASSLRQSIIVLLSFVHPAARILTLQSLVCPVWLFPSSLLFSLSLSLSFSLSSTVTVCLLPGLTPSSSFIALFSLLSAFSFLFFSSFFLSYFILHPSLISISATYFYPDCPCHSLFFNPIPTSEHSVYINHLSLSTSISTSLPTSLLASATNSLSMLAFQQYNLVFATVAPARPPSPPIRPLDRFL